ncbi:organic hydroperoxide resistance protein [Mongoliimonas terrestris]|uniref:organic hydroperoxide resistance protein n=1 Tax=Mongoliimonas terrestris TaxID=1709001 RepID=UPI0009499D5B|nr:organic hydroperoxide resistance protein [Mongoliimonas terrestris]
MKILYTTRATAAGGRDGLARSEDGNLAVKLVVPKEMGGPGGEGTNPEQLFAAGYSACFLGALRFVAGNEKIKIPPEATVTATVGIGPRDDGTGFSITAELAVSVPGLEPAVVEDLVQKAHVVCPYSHATRGNVDVKLSVA